MKALLGLFAVVLGSQAAVFTVTTKFDAGAGSLRQAILDANANPGLDTIQFNLPGSGVQTIGFSDLLPDVTDPVVIDGTTQPGYAGTPLIEIAGTSVKKSVYLLKITGGGSTVRGLLLQKPSNNPPSDGVVLSGGSGNKVEACWIGITANGAGRGSIYGAGVHLIDSANNVIGGSDPAQRNIISGANTAGVMIEGASAAGNKVSGNYIGLDPSGKILLRNFVSGVLVSNAPANTISSNVIAADSGSGVRIAGNRAAGNLVQGNWIGLKADGTAFNTGLLSGTGITIDNAPGNTIGGPAASARNVLADLNLAILVTGTGAASNVVQGNYVGTDPAGLSAISNQFGIRIAAGASGTLIGGTQAGMGNVLSATKVDALSIQNSSGNTVQGNLIGTDATGRAALGNTTPGTTGSGITVAAISAPAHDNLIGGATAAAANVVSGNNDSGIVILGPDAQNNRVQGNLIGMARDVVTVLGNASYGVAVLGANNNVVGGTNPGEGNLIVANGIPLKHEGIYLAGEFGSFGTIGTGNLVVGNAIAASGGAGVTLLGPNEIRGNMFIANGGIEIDRAGDGPTPNSPQNPVNAPVFTSASFGSVKGTFVITNGEPNCTYTVTVYVTRTMAVLTDLFSPLPPVDAFFQVPGGGFGLPGPPPGNASYVISAPAGSVTIQTDGQGNARREFELPWDQPGEGQTLSGTAFSDCAHETSEFGIGIPIQVLSDDTRAVVFFQRPFLREVDENEGTLQVKIYRLGGLDGISSVHVQTLPVNQEDVRFVAPALPGIDFVPLDTVVTFAPGETEKTVSIQINDDSTYTGARQFNLQLSNPVNAQLASFSGQASRVAVAILDDEKPAEPKLAIATDELHARLLELEEGLIPPGGIVIQSTPKLTPADWAAIRNLIPADSPYHLPDPDNPAEVFRALFPNQYGLMTFASLDGGAGVQWDVGGQVSGTADVGKSVVAPQGPMRFKAALESQLKMADGSTKPFRNGLYVIGNVNDETEVKLKSDIQVQNIVPPCNCTPWAGLVGGTVGATQKVVAGGGESGTCLDDAQVHIVGPGIDMVLAPGETQRTFDPAEDGVWTVTSTVCGASKTVTITLP